MVCVLPAVGAQDNWLVVMEYSEDQQRGAATAGCEAAPDKLFYNLWRACTFILIFAGLTASGQQLVQNGGFETGDYTGWTQSGNLQGTSVSTSSLYVHSGNYGAQLGPTKSLGFLSQTVATSSGQSYLLSIWLENSDNRSGTQFEISWNGTTIFNTVNLPVIGWINLQFIVSATASSTVLQFGFEDDHSFLGLDDISLTKAPPNTGGPVAVYGAPATNTWNNDVTNKIVGTGFFPRADGYLVSPGNAVPTLAQLQQYSSVLVYSDAPFNDPVALGNVLADYLDAGGGVVLATFGFYNSNSNNIQGRISSAGYLPLTVGGYTTGNGETLAADEPLHPILSGVNSFNGGTSSYHCSGIATTVGATLVAQWSDGQTLVATKQLTTGRVVALNFYPPSSDVRSDLWVASTDGARLMANALLWAAGTNGPPQITQQPLSQTVTINQSVLFSSNVTFTVTATGISPLSYQWQFDGANLGDTARISGSKSNVLTIAGVRMSDAGKYSVLVSNALGSTQSAVAFLNVLTAPAAVFGWGYNYDGEIDPPTGPPGFAAIASRDYSSVGLQTNGMVANWGLDRFYSPPVGLSNVVAIAAGGDSSARDDFSLALEGNGAVAAWGDDSYGQTNVPLGLANVQAIAAGGYHSMAIQSNGTVVAWGDDSYGETNVPPGLSNVIAVAAGNYYSLALQNNGVVVAWGDNNFGSTNVPRGLSNVVAIAAGAYHSLALKNDGTVVAWGYNNSRQTNVPPGLSNVVAIAAGSYHSLALKSNGTIVGWGDDFYGETNSPLSPFGLSNVVAIAAGNGFSQALTYTPPTRPSNDNFANAISFFGSSVTEFGDNFNATWEPLENGIANSGPASVWWEWIPDHDASVTISTLGSSFSTELAVYTGSSVSAVSLVANDANTVNFFATAGTQYYIDVDGYNGGNGPAEGNITLSLNQCVPPTISVFYAGQTTGTDGVHVHFGATINSSGVGLSCDHWQVLSPVNYITTIDEGCTNFEVVVSPTNQLPVIVTNFVSDSCGQGGGSGSGGSTCSICLSRGTPSLLTGTTGSGKLAPIISVPPPCGTVSSNAQWYQMIPTNGTGFITVSTQGSSNATLLAVFDGPLNAFTNIACNNGITASNKISVVTFFATEGTVYWIAVDPETNNAAANMRVASGFRPSIASYGMSNGVFTLQSSTAPAITYQLLASTNLGASLSNWPVALSTNLSTNYPYLNYQETNMKAYPRRFYLLKPQQ